MSQITEQSLRRKKKEEGREETNVGE